MSWPQFAFAITVVACAPAFADFLYFPPLDPKFFGNLQQSESHCGPASAVNSFVYLQRLYPNIYGARLVPSADPQNPTQAEMQSAETNLASSMHTDATGTSSPDFIKGKQEYMDGVAFGVSSFFVQMAEMWPVQDGVKPPYVSDSTNPTAIFIYTQLKKGRDVEILGVKNGVLGHWVTVTGITYDTAIGSGTIDYVDPDTGMAAHSRLDGTSFGGLAINLDFQLLTAVSEGPVSTLLPEPKTGVLVAIGASLIVCVRRRSRRRLAAG